MRIKFRGRVQGGFGERIEAENSLEADKTVPVRRVGA